MTTDTRVEYRSLKISSQELLVRAREVARNAHNPYSGFHVGAAVRVDTGDIFCGTFFEVASFPEGVCAERVAIGSAVTAGKKNINEIAIVGGKLVDEPQKIITPCGGCRQAILEMNGIATQEILVVCSDYGLNFAITIKASELLPHAFP